MVRLNMVQKSSWMVTYVVHTGISGFAFLLRESSS